MPYYSTYIDKVPSGDIRETLERQKGETRTFLEGISEEKSRHRYAAGHVAHHIGLLKERYL